MEDTNAQPQVTPAPAATGPTVAELQAQLDDAKRQREGLIRDLQSERDKRQELASQLSSSVSPTVTPAVTDDELGQVLKPYIAPALKEIERLKAESANEKALTYLSSKTGKSVDQILADKDFQDKLMGVARKWGLGGDSYTMSKRAYELMELEEVKNKEEERKRSANASASQTLPSGTAPVQTSNARKYSADEFNKMDPRMFGDLADKGNFRKLPDGTFEYSPR